MIESHERVEQFKQEISDMKVRDPNTGRDRVWLRVGIALMVIGLAVAIGAYFMSHNTSNPLEQNDALVLALAGVAGTVIGAAVFLAAALAFGSPEARQLAARLSKFRVLAANRAPSDSRNESRPI